MASPDLAAGGRTVTVHVALSIRKRGGRKLVLALDGTTVSAHRRPRIDNAMVKAIVRAFRWRKQLETRTHASVAEIATAEKINDSYVGRILRLTLLAPETVEAILDGEHAPQITLAALMGPFPAEWENQSRAFETRRA
jgi:hypothetical protein